jgi:hypothetical protein
MNRTNRGSRFNRSAFVLAAADWLTFSILRMFGLLCVAWRYCPIYPDAPYWVMGLTAIPLVIVTMGWTIACMPICFTILKLADLIASKIG